MLKETENPQNTNWDQNLTQKSIFVVRKWAPKWLHVASKFLIRHRYLCYRTFKHKNWIKMRCKRNRAFCHLELFFRIKDDGAYSATNLRCLFYCTLKRFGLKRCLFWRNTLYISQSWRFMFCRPSPSEFLGDVR